MSAYVLVDVEVLNPEAYAEYTRDVPATLEPFGGRFLVRGGAVETLEGEASAACRPDRVPERGAGESLARLARLRCDPADPRPTRPHQLPGRA